MIGLRGQSVNGLNLDSLDGAPAAIPLDVPEEEEVIELILANWKRCQRGTAAAADPATVGVASNPPSVRE